MPYCPRCGVELDTGIRGCPLCYCEIPRFEEEAPSPEPRFPVPENLYGLRIAEAKKQVFIGLSILFLGAILTLFSLHYLAGLDGKATNYATLSLFASWFYLFFIFGYITNPYLAITGGSVVSFLLLLGIDIIHSGITWSADIGIPVVLLSTIILLCGVRIYKRFKRKNQFVLIPIYIFTGAAIFCPGLEVILDYTLTGSVSLTWSVIVLIPLLSIAAVLAGLYLNLPERIREKIKSRLHY